MDFTTKKQPRLRVLQRIFLCETRKSKCTLYNENIITLGEYAYTPFADGSTEKTGYIGNISICLQILPYFCCLIPCIKISEKHPTRDVLENSQYQCPFQRCVHVNTTDETNTREKN